jgi:hypothetical protein
MKKPSATPIAAFPKQPVTGKAAAPKKIPGLWPGGVRTQKDWLKAVRKPHDKIKFKRQTGLAPKAAVDSSQRPVFGLPPPIADVLESEDLMSLWNARWEPERVRAADWRPERDAIYIAGRPVRVLIVSHHGAGPLEWDSYPNMIFYPLRPLVLYGPHAKSTEASKMNPKFSVIQWWKVFVFYSILCLHHGAEK